MYNSKHPWLGNMYNSKFLWFGNMYISKYPWLGSMYNSKHPWLGNMYNSKHPLLGNMYNSKYPWLGNMQVLCCHSPNAKKLQIGENKWQREKKFTIVYKNQYFLSKWLTRDPNNLDCKHGRLTR